MILDDSNNNTTACRQRTKPPSCGRCAALAAEKALDFGGIAQDQCLLHRLGALIPRRHLASPVHGSDRAVVEILSQRRWRMFMP